jgi:chromosome segregation protein
LYLSKLEILGFKSFAQKTSINFNEGVTSIVGPNGCGKTNIVDAIRWCLGEQKSGTLRSDKMENVIFNGTSSKKPMGMAEVSLIIENTKGILPTEFSEVTITRRIFRSGESEYLLNKNICRLKDITNLFMDTGIGANAYSVIELKMVETILSSKAEERRTMFEEAAGVNKYKLRRRLALRKLDEVKSNLVRVDDIVSEVEKKVNSLERQAKKAEKYNKISLELKELELDFSERELALFATQKKESILKKDDGIQKKIKLDSNLTELEDKIKSSKSNLREIEFQLESKRAEVTSLTEKIYNVQKNISVNEERIKSLESNIERYKEERDDLKNQLEENKNSINENFSNVEEIKKQIVLKEKEKNKIDIQLNEQKNQLDKKRIDLKTFSDELLDKFKEVTNLENELLNINKSLESKNQAIDKLKQRINSLTNNIAKTVGFIEELNKEKNETENNLNEAEEIYSQKQKEKENLEKEINGLKEKELEDRTALNSLKEKINFIQNLIDNLEGVSKGAKALIEDDTWALKDKTLLAYIGDTPEKYRSAVESSLKNNLNSILVETFQDLKNGISFLNNNEIGKASFYVTGENRQEKKGMLEKIGDWGTNRKIKALEKEDGFLGWAKDFVQVNKKWSSFFNKILIKTAVIDSFDTAFILSEKYSGFNFATLNGDYIDANGIIEAGSTPKLDDSLFGRKQHLENLKNEFPGREENLQKLKIKIDETEEKLNSIDLKILSDKGKLLANDLANVEKQISQFEFEKTKAADEIEKYRKEIHELASESNKIDNEAFRLGKIFANQTEEKQKSDKKKEELENEFSNFEKEYNELVTGQNKINLDLERYSGERKNLENSITRALDSIEIIKKSISKREFDISSSGEEKETLKNIIEGKNGELNDLESGKEILIQEEKEIDAKHRESQSQISDLESTRDIIQKNRESISEDIHSADIKLNELNIKISNLKENIKEDYSISLQEKVFDDLDTFDFEKRSEEVHNLKQQVKNLGPINLLAYSEFEEEKERFEFLSKQKNDLIESEKDISKTIEEINNAAQTQFMETFEKIREHFVNIFRGLFNPGDEADLKIELDADPLEAKIEIIAKPKGKRPTSIELLSGGEKTLTAIALLFAIYLVKPSPFCILDEIDAPLDDANIDRFTKIIEDFSKDTQFIIVTHNKRTMEAAQTLYGVTMQEEGISKLVSVRFDENLIQQVPGVS